MTDTKQPTDPLHRIADALDRIATALEADPLPMRYEVEPTPGPWAQKFQQDAVAAWDELCADPPPGTWFYDGIGWDIYVEGTGVGASYWNAAIIPEHANDGREFVAVRPGVTLPDGLAHPMTEKPVRGGKDD